MDDMEVLAGATIEQIEEMALAEQKAADAGTGDEVADAGAAAAEQAVVDGAAAGAENAEGDQALTGDAVAMKSGKGTIPYAVLKETRDELARANQQLKLLKQSSIDTAAATLPENHATQMSDVNVGLQALGKKFEDGNIDWEEYQSELTELNTRKEALLREEIRVQVAKDIADNMATQNQAAAMTTWKETVEGFLGTQHDGFDYRANKALYGELDTMVKALGNDPANNDKDHQWFLDTAHAVVMVKHGGPKVITPTPTPQPNQQQGLTAPFHTLSDLPGGEIPNNNAVEQVTQLSGEALTNRFLNDPSQIDKVLNSLAM